MKLLTAETCPNCKHNFESEKELENLEPVRHEGKIKEVQTKEIPEKQPEIKEVIKKVTKNPNYLPNIHCKGCKRTHENPDYENKVTHKCTNGNCGQFTSDPEKPCLFCKNKEFEELDEDTLSMIDDPPHKEHDHEHTED